MHGNKTMLSLLLQWRYHAQNDALICTKLPTYTVEEVKEFFYFFFYRQRIQI